ncbi:MAG TPA: hypothetical protein V6D10_07980 [Trichocoleus sp.]
MMTEFLSIDGIKGDGVAVLLGVRCSPYLETGLTVLHDAPLAFCCL